MEVAQQSDHPVLMRYVSKVQNTPLMLSRNFRTYKKSKDLEMGDTKVEQNNTQNNIFMSGSTADLMKMLKNPGKG